MNLFHVMGGASANIVRGNVSFENIDISSHHSDGSGFVSTGRLATPLICCLVLGLALLRRRRRD